MRRVAREPLRVEQGVGAEQESSRAQEVHERLAQQPPA
jgi:hypothetical protein